MKVWRLDKTVHAATWASGEGARLYGGRWNSKGVACTYGSLEIGTAILETAVHKKLEILDSIPHELTCFEINDEQVHVVQPTDIPNPNWLRPGTPTSAQQRFGDALIAAHIFVSIPSVVVHQVRNIIFDPTRAAGRFTLISQERFALDPRLAPNVGS